MANITVKPQFSYGSKCIRWDINYNKTVDCIFFVDAPPTALNISINKDIYVLYVDWSSKAKCYYIQSSTHPEINGTWNSVNGPYTLPWINKTYQITISLDSETSNFTIGM